MEICFVNGPDHRLPADSGGGIFVPVSQKLGVRKAERGQPARRPLTLAHLPGYPSCSST
jgi:hypothetical protein